MKTSIELKAIAKESLKGKWGQSIGALVLFSVVSSIPFCSPALQLGYFKYNVKIIRKEDSKVGDVFYGFNLFGKALWLTIITAFFSFLWSALFVIPGIIKQLSYFLAPFILSDNPQMTAREALSESKRLMKGRKGRLFYIELSFIVWILIGVITVGIGLLWIIPYMTATFSAFYDDALNG